MASYYRVNKEDISVLMNTLQKYSNHIFYEYIIWCFETVKGFLKNASNLELQSYPSIFYTNFSKLMRSTNLFACAQTELSLIAVHIVHKLYFLL